MKIMDLFRKEEPKKSDLEIAVEELQDAVVELHRVRDAFNFAEQEYFDVANSEVTLANERYTACLNKVKQLSNNKITRGSKKKADKQVEKQTESLEMETVDLLKRAEQALVDA